jgi:hypothetical protein
MGRTCEYIIYSQKKITLIRILKMLDPVLHKTIINKCYLNKTNDFTLTISNLLKMRKKEAKAWIKK